MSGLRERLTILVSNSAEAYYAKAMGDDEYADPLSDKVSAQVSAIEAEFDPPWTAVEDGLPGVGVSVWVTVTVSVNFSVVRLYWRDAVGEWYLGKARAKLTEPVTHWKPARVPSPPEGL